MNSTNLKVGDLTFKWTPKHLIIYTQCYNRAIQSGQNSFVFGGETVDVEYASYLIEYLNNQFNPTKQAFPKGRW